MDFKMKLTKPKYNVDEQEKGNCKDDEKNEENKKAIQEKHTIKR